MSGKCFQRGPHLEDHAERQEEEKKENIWSLEDDGAMISQDVHNL